VKTLTLEEEEAYYEVHCGICNADTRRPYGELGSVDKTNVLCCKGVSSDLFRGWCVAPGCGCQEEKVDEIVAELKARMKERGDTGQIRRTDEVVEEVRALREDVSEMKEDMKKIMQALNIEVATVMER